MREVRLPGLIGHHRLEAHVRGAGPLAWLRRHQPGLVEVAADRRWRDPGGLVLAQVPGDGVRPGVQALGGELLAQREDLDDQLIAQAGWGALGSPRARLEGRLALLLVARDEPRDPSLRESVGARYLALGATLDYHRCDHQAGFGHA